MVPSRYSGAGVQCGRAVWCRPGAVLQGCRMGRGKGYTRLSKLPGHSAHRLLRRLRKARLALHRQGWCRRRVGLLLPFGRNRLRVLDVVCGTHLLIMGSARGRQDEWRV